MGARTLKKGSSGQLRWGGTELQPALQKGEGRSMTYLALSFLPLSGLSSLSVLHWVSHTEISLHESLGDDIVVAVGLQDTSRTEKEGI